VFAAAGHVPAAAYRLSGGGKAVAYLHSGDWEIDANGVRGTLRVDEIDALGRISGTLFGQRITGWWSERARRLSFIRAGEEADGEQGYEGYAWDERPDAGQPRVYHLAGSFETFGGRNGAKDRQTFGWFATSKRGKPGFPVSPLLEHLTR
jgi:hypothetical protein